MPRFRYPEDGDGQGAYNDGRTQRAPHAARHAAQAGSAANYGQQGAYGQPTGQYGQDAAEPYGQQPSYGQAQVNPYGAASNPYTSAGQAEPNPYATSQQPYGQQGAYVPSSNPYVPGSYSSEDDYGYGDGGANPYAAAPSSGAVNMGHEQVAGSSRSKRKRGSGEGMPGAPRKRRRRAPMVAIVLIVLAVLAGGGAYLYFNPPLYKVNVNGTERIVHSGSTLQDIVDEGFASPTAGNLLAVDGSVCVEGGGDKFEATVNGEATNDPSYVVPRHATVQFENGNDTTEEYTETTETIAHGTSGEDMSSFNLYWAGSIHIYSEGEDGEQVTKTGKTSGISVTEVTKQPVDAGYHVYTADTGDDKVIALTFDDGPWGSTTSEILDILKENGAHATFFQIGNQVAENSEIEKRIADEGHQIATHTYDHASGSGNGVDLTKMSADEQVQEVEKGFSAIEDVLGTSVSRIMRAPGGNYYGSIITNLSSHVTAEIGWDVDTEDWRKPGAQSIADAIMSAKSGNVVLMHDGGGDRSQTVEGLRIALPQLVAQGYKFVTIDELLAYGMPGSN